MKGVPLADYASMMDERATFLGQPRRKKPRNRNSSSRSRRHKLLALRHEYLNNTSMLEDFDEGCCEATPYLYSVANLEATGAQVRRNVGTPMWMRGPGAVPGLYALESGMNELADALGIDPLQLRLKNDSEKDESQKNIPFSSRHLRECLEVGAKKFGWEKRNPATGSMQRDGKVLGWIDLAGILPKGDVSDPEAVLNGIAYDAAGDRLFVTGKLWPKLFEIKVAPHR